MPGQNGVRTDLCGVGQYVAEPVKMDGVGAQNSTEEKYWVSALRRTTVSRQGAEFMSKTEKQH